MMMDGTASNASESDDESYSFVDEGSSSSDDDNSFTFDEDEDDFSTNTNGDNDAHGDAAGGGHEGNRTRYRHMRAVLRQHLPAIVIAIAAAAVGHAHLNDGEFLHVTLTGLYRDFVEHRANANGGMIGGRNNNSNKYKGGKFAAAPTLNAPTPYPTAPSPHISPTINVGSTEADNTNHHQHYHHEYRRTANLGFCQDHDEVNINRSNNDSRGVRKLLLGGDENDDESFVRYKYQSPVVNDNDDGDTNDKGMGNVDNINPGLVPFDFRIPKDLVSTMGVHYLADEKKEDAYASVLAAGEPDTYAVDREYQCLRNKAEASNGKHNLKGWGLAYLQPDVSTFYRETGGAPDDSVAGTDLGTGSKGAVSGQAPDMPSVKSILKSRRDEHLQNNPEAAAEAAQREEQAATGGGDSDIGNQITAVAPNFGGFAAKLTNLSPEPMNLFWDGRGGSDARLVGRVPPFESLGTATTPGQSFSLVPVTHDKYDDRFVLQRWTMTADEAHVYYDPSPSDLDKLTTEQQTRYRMWKLNQAYARDYLIKTKRTWLADFPRPAPIHFMHTAEYFGKTKTVKSFERHFTTRPPRSELKKLSYADHEHRLHREARYGKDLSISLPKYRQEGAREVELKMETISCAPQVFKVDGFLSAVEVEHIIDIVKDGSRNITLTRSTVHPGGVSNYGDDAEKAGNEQMDAATRSSTNAWIEREADAILDSIYRRAADLLGIDESLLRHRSDEEHPELATDHSIAERMQLVHYGEGEEYHAHHDFSYPALGNRLQPGRFATLLLYLNDVQDGGETVFPRAVNSETHDGIKVKPKTGTAVLFYNTLPDGNFDDLSQHQSTPVRSGEKYLANLWVWDPIID